MSLRLGAFVLIGLALAAGPAWAQRGPVKIGMLVPLAGPLSANGREMANGLSLLLQEEGQRLAGREVHLIVADTEGKPPIALNKARALAESQGVHVLVGPLATAEAYALLGYIESRKIPTAGSSFRQVGGRRPQVPEDRHGPVYSRDWPPCRGAEARVNADECRDFVRSHRTMPSDSELKGTWAK